MTAAYSQGVEIEITADRGDGSVHIHAKRSDDTDGKWSRNLHFRGQMQAKDRIEGLEIQSGGKATSFRRLMANEYLADNDFDELSYSVKLGSTARNAHSSWIDASAGMLYLDDLLPEGAGDVGGRVLIKLPADWKVFSTGGGSATKFAVKDVSRGVLIIGKDLEARAVKDGSVNITAIVEGWRQFTADAVATIAPEVYRYYSKVLGKLTQDQILIAALSSGSPLPNGTWEAETKGATVTIVSADFPFRTRSVQLLHEQLRHEIFHLWFPNGVRLKGDYSFFYEGLALYASLKLAAVTGQIRFEDFLDTLSRAYQIDASTRPGPFLPPAVRTVTEKYARGLLVGFSTDVELLSRGSGPGIEGALSRIYKANARSTVSEGNAPDGNEVFRRELGTPAILERFVVRGEKFEWGDVLDKAGLSLSTTRHATLSVIEHPKGKQRTLLNKLGYNAWRNNGKIQ